jgi:Holliday junction resolvase RusA-like endonuclease
MAKRKLKIHFRIPRYVSPRNQWRRLIYDAACAEMQARHVAYQPHDLLTVSLVFYLEDSALGIHDVDNRLKDVLDALQGRMGGPKSVRQYEPLIPNDKQIFRVTVRKVLPPPQSHGLGHVTVSRCT